MWAKNRFNCQLPLKQQFEKLHLIWYCVIGWDENRTVLYCSGEVWVRWSTQLLKIHKYAYSLINTIEKTYYRTLCFISFKITSCVKLCLTPPIFNFKVAISVFKFNKAKAKTFPTELHRHLALHHFFPTMDHLQWTGAVRMRVQTAGLLWCFY